jgi:hypothetical protein
MPRWHNAKPTLARLLFVVGACQVARRASASALVLATPAR